MYAMQYEMTLPADYSMGVIRERVAGLGHVLDDRAGLGVKAYLIREKGIGGSPVNQYAPFYLWNDTGAMGHFLLGGGGFQGIVRAFGRPVVRQWTGVAQYAGPDRTGGVPVAASRRLRAVPDDVDGSGTGLAAWVEESVAATERLAGRAGVHTVAFAVDPHHWQAVEFALWTSAVPADLADADRYEVLHLSAPEIKTLPNGRCW